MLRYIFLLFLFLPFIANSQTQNVISWDKYAITGSLALGKDSNGRTDPATYAHPSAILQLGRDTSNKGFLPTRVLHEDSIPDPIQGMLTYAYSCQCFVYYDGLTWKRVGGIDTCYQRGDTVFCVKGVVEFPVAVTSTNAVKYSDTLTTIATRSWVDSAKANIRSTLVNKLNVSDTGLLIRNQNATAQVGNAWITGTFRATNFVRVANSLTTKLGEFVNPLEHALYLGASGSLTNSNYNLYGTGNELYINHPTEIQLRIANGATPKIDVTSSGVGFGKTSPTAPIDVQGASSTTGLAMRITNLSSTALIEAYNFGRIRIAAPSYTGTVSSIYVPDGDSIKTASVSLLPFDNKSTYNYGNSTYDPSSGTVTIAHGLSGVPSYINFQFSDYTYSELREYEVSVDGTNITITFANAPPTSDLKIWWEARLSR